VQDEGATYAMLSSCLRVLRLTTSTEFPSKVCSVPNEICCVETAEQRVAVFWSMERKDGTDALVTSDPEEFLRLNKVKTICEHLLQVFVAPFSNAHLRIQPHQSTHHMCCWR
jgi:hypothetical protein